MKISLNWVKEFTPIKLDNEELLRRIASRIGAIESVVDLAPVYKDIVVAEIVGAKPHADADKLGVYQVKIGSKQVQVVAGDKTLERGHKIAYIPPGTTVPLTYFDAEPFVLEKVVLRGEESNGMLASARELNFSEEHVGVLKLDTKLPAGTPLSEAYELDDLIIEIENKALTHRPDCFGIIGLARELAGIQDLAFTSPKWLTVKPNLKGSGLKLAIDNQVPDATPRYTAIAMSGVKLGPSPVKLQSYLQRLGVRPINNVVDTTNYLMLMTGQPLHAFDYDKVAGAKIVVRHPKKGEKVALLDGRTIEPHPKAILIADESAPIGLGGVMGGADSEISDNTTNIIIESANFDLYSIRKTSMEHGIFTEAVTRFARGQDPNACLPVLGQAVELVQRLAGGQVASAVQDSYPHPRKPQTTIVSADFINSRLGSDLSAAQITKTFRNLELEVSGSPELHVTAPTWRADLSITEDYVEEAGRLNGYDELVPSLPARDLSPPTVSALMKAQTKLRRVLKAAGANELLTYSFLSEQLLEQSGLDAKRAYHIRNALSPQLRYIRTALQPSLIEKIHPNQRAGHEQFAIYEVNKVHSRDVPQPDEQDLPLEQWRLSLATAWSEKAAGSKYQGAPYYLAKRYLDFLGDRFNCQFEYRPVAESKLSREWADLARVFEPNRTAAIELDGQVVGLVGEYRSAVRRSFKLPAASAGFEIDFSRLVDEQSTRYQPLSRYPSTEQDLTLTVDAGVAMAAVRATLVKALASSVLVVSVEPHDAYQGEGAQTKNLTFRLTLQHLEKTLTTKEAESLIEQAVASAAKAHGAQRV